MSKEKEALKLALEALEDTLSGDLTPYQAAKTITAIKEALAEQPAQQLDGWRLVPSVPTNEWINNLAKAQTGSLEEVPFVEIHQCIAELLDAAPQPAQPAQPSKPLTVEQIIDLWNQSQGTRNGFGPFARAIEQAHGITGEQK